MSAPTYYLHNDTIMPCPNGALMYTHDHENIVAALEAKVKALREALKNTLDVCVSLDCYNHYRPVIAHGQAALEATDSHIQP